MVVKVGDWVESAISCETTIKKGGIYEVSYASEFGFVIYGEGGVKTYLDLGEISGVYPDNPNKTSSPPTPSQKPSSFNDQVGGSHYKGMKIQPTQYCIANKIPFPEGNVIKYVSRWRNKNGIDDLKKAHHTLQMIIEAVEAGDYD